MEEITKKDLKKYLKKLSFYSTIYGIGLFGAILFNNYKIEKEQEPIITSLNDLYLNYPERGIFFFSDHSALAFQSINEISNFQLDDLDTAYIDALETDPEEILNIYNSYAIADRILNNFDLPHSYDTYYNAKNDTIS